MSDQGDLFIPPPDISGKTNGSGRDAWYDRRFCVWVTDPMDLFLSEAQLHEKYDERALSCVSASDAAE